MEDLRVGTCSWTDRSLVGSGWYPDNARDPYSRLRHYANFFDTVEVDSTFYAIPGEEVFYQWAARTTPGFLFNIKAFGLFTFHTLSVTALPRELMPPGISKGSRLRIWEIPKDARIALWDRFISRVLVLNSLNRLGYLLFQFPPWIVFSERNLNWFKRIAKLASPARVAIEIRHRSWLEKGNRERFLDLLRDQNMAFTAVDEPSLEWTVPPEWHITATWGTVLRFHGRNAPAWNKRDAKVAERFNYLYDITELAPFSEKAKVFAKDVGRVFLMFNNCFRDNAVRNALEMRALLGVDVGDRGQEMLNLWDMSPGKSAAAGSKNSKTPRGTRE
ncbi:MAG: DUF72 domain-containing protein [Thermovirga sp.]|nr:DUF72 domain-containing protein [Thermovirga sp.]